MRHTSMRLGTWHSEDLLAPVRQRIAEHGNGADRAALPCQHLEAIRGIGTDRLPEERLVITATSSTNSSPRSSPPYTAYLNGSRQGPRACVNSLFTDDRHYRSVAKIIGLQASPPPDASTWHQRGLRGSQVRLPVNNCLNPRASPGFRSSRWPSMQTPFQNATWFLILKASGLGNG